MALDALAPQLDVHGLPPGALALPLPHTAGDASEISGDGSDGEITHLVEADTELAPFLLSLLGDEQPTVIRALACRALARCAYRGGRWREAVVEAGGCRVSAGWQLRSRVSVAGPPAWRCQYVTQHTMVLSRIPIGNRSCTSDTHGDTPQRHFWT
eukprot:scaffold223969_cov30-Tisochrysis_lutea.AAC.6